MIVYIIQGSTWKKLDGLFRFFSRYQSLVYYIVFRTLKKNKKGGESESYILYCTILYGGKITDFLFI